MVDDPEQVVHQLDTHINRVNGIQFGDVAEFVFHIKESFPQGARIRFDDDLIGLRLLCQGLVVYEIDQVVFGEE